MTTTTVDKPLKTDRQADRAARRADRLASIKGRIEARRKARVEKLEARIRKINAEAKTRTDEVDEIHGPLVRRLIDYVVAATEKGRTVTLSTGTELTVSTVYSVVARDGDDNAAIAELLARGYTQFVRIPPIKPELDRASLRQTDHRRIVEEMATLTLEPSRTLAIKLAEQ